MEENMTNSMAELGTTTLTIRDDNAIYLYLDLMKRCLTDSIYLDDPLSQFIFYCQKPNFPFWKRLGVTTLERFLAKKRIRMVEAHSQHSLEHLRIAREGGKDWPARAHTMIGLKRLDNIQSCVESVIK